MCGISQILRSESDFKDCAFLLFYYFMAKKTIWPPMSGHNSISWPKSKSSKSLHQICGMPHREGAFQVSNMLAVQINAPFVSFQYSDLKVLRVYCIHRQIQIFKYSLLGLGIIFLCRFLHFLHLNVIFKNI